MLEAIYFLQTVRLRAYVFSVFFAVLLIPLGIVGYKAWRLMKAMKQQNGGQTDGESITAEYTVISDTDKK